VLRWQHRLWKMPLLVNSRGWNILATMRALMAAFFLCAVLSACGLLYVSLDRAARAQVACLRGLFIAPDEGCWGTRLEGGAEWAAGWP